MDGPRRSFKAALSQASRHDVENRLHERAMRGEASKFVGREELLGVVYNHCTSPHVNNSVMVVKGDVGVGKSAVLSTVASRCLQMLRPLGTRYVYVFCV